MSQPKVLVVDDSRTVRTLVKRALHGAGYEVEAAADGQEALELAQEQPPDLLVLDIEMPRVDGYSVCQQLREMGEPWSQTPIIFLTNVQSHALNLLGEELGAYLPKPVCDQLLLDTVARFTRPAALSQNGVNLE